MAQDSASNMVFLIVSLTVAAAVGGVIIQYSQEISDSIKERGSDLSRQIETDVTIVNDPDYMYEQINGENRLVIYAKNTGSVSLENKLRVVDVFVDGAYLNNENIKSFEVMNNNTWAPSTVAKLTADYSLNEGDHEVKIEIFNSDDSLKFRLGG